MGYRNSPIEACITQLLRECRKSSRRFFLRQLSLSAFAALTLGRSGKASRSAGTGQLHLRIFDGAQPVPARLHVELPDGAHWTPVAAPTHYARPEILTGREFGPMLAPARCSLDWTHLRSGEALLELPSGKSRVYISRGFEYLPLQFDVVISQGKTLKEERQLHRWIDMPAQGFYSGDIHQHFTRESSEVNRPWVALAEAEDLHLINTMVLKHGEPSNRYPQYDYGPEGTFQEGHYVIAPGEEFRDNELSGHMTIAGNTQLIEPVSTGPSLGLRDSFPPFAVACREARRQGAIVGWAHGGLAGVTAKTLHDLTPRGIESVSVEAALGLIDFLEVVQFTRFLGEPFWYRLLGSGAKLAGVGGTDFPFGIWLAPWYPTFGQERTYVQVQGAFSAQSWFEGIRRGFVFSSNGPMIWLNVEGRQAGTTLELSGKGKVRVRTAARCAYPLDSLEIVLNGKVIAAAEPEDSERKKIELDREVDIERSSWISARVGGSVTAETFGGVKDWPLVGHAGVVHVSVGGKPVRVEEDLQFLLGYTTQFKDHVRRKGVFDTPEHRSLFIENVDEALSIYRQRLSEDNGR